ncbi:MAG: NAD(P)H-dependent oxidoreductase subunit E, partial [bacterium]
GLDQEGSRTAYPRVVSMGQTSVVHKELRLEMAPKSALSQLDLCATCNHVEICTFRSNWVGPVIHCEEFDNTGAVAPDRVGKAPLSAAAESGVSPGPPEENEPYKGLCVNCDARDVCRYAVSDRVVWYCEEYRLAELPKLVPESLLPPFGTKGPAAARREADVRKPRAELEAADICALLEKHDTGRGGLMAVLEEIQSSCGYLPEELLCLVAEKTDRSMVDLYGIATFYRSFRLNPRGRHTVSVCLGTACHVRGAPMLVDEFKRQLDVKPQEETTLDGAFTLETVNCLGACALGPIVVGDDHCFSKVEPPKVRSILRRIRTDAHAVDVRNDPRFFPVPVRCGRCDHSLMDPVHLIDGHPSVRLNATYRGEQGWVRLSSLYGSYAVEYEHDIPVNAKIDFSCSHCGGALKGAASCPECGCPMAPMIAEGGGMAQICTMRGCKGHALDLTFDYF